MNPIDFDVAYRRRRFEQIRDQVKRGAIGDAAAAFAVTVSALELDMRRQRNGIEAATAGETRSGSTEGESPVLAQQECAQTIDIPHHHPNGRA